MKLWKSEKIMALRSDHPEAFNFIDKVLNEDDKAIKRWRLATRLDPQSIHDLPQPAVEFKGSLPHLIALANDISEKVRNMTEAELQELTGMQKGIMYIRRQKVYQIPSSTINRIIDRIQGDRMMFARISGIRKHLKNPEEYTESDLKKDTDRPDAKILSVEASNETVTLSIDRSMLIASRRGTTQVKLSVDELERRTKREQQENLTYFINFFRSHFNPNLGTSYMRVLKTFTPTL
ncbi:MAG TPA: hypothetical protein VI875_02610 [Candidatus Norongarragalinales archaeon]|nr:hypothetical protein [Candidatus Norongarragalinales archaeon]